MRTWPKTINKINTSTKIEKTKVEHKKLESKLGPYRSICEYRGGNSRKEISRRFEKVKTKSR